MALAEALSLRRHIDNAPADQFFFDRAARVDLAALLAGSSLGGRLAELSGRSVLIATTSQLTSALALIELDGVARRLTILPPDVERASSSRADGGRRHRCRRDRWRGAGGFRRRCRRGRLHTKSRAGRAEPAGSYSTEWVLLTSGTTGVPKMVVHSLAGLTAAIASAQRKLSPIVWGTFYDIRRYGGLQIFLRAVLGGASLILSSAGEPVADHLFRLARHGVTHLSGTPSHWRRALMSPAIGKISPRYVRLSGEIADQAILDNLRAAFPQAGIGHAYASTEAGVGFAVNDGLAGFPAAYLDGVGNGVEMKVVDGSLRIRSPGAASRYVGARAAPLLDDDGFVDTGDMVERRGDRYFFVGRKGGIINIGGLKVHPEEVEAVINRHPQVRMSLVRPKRSPFTGAIVIADVVLKSAVPARRGRDWRQGRHSRTLPRRAAAPQGPVAISFVPALAVAATGKLARRG